jgi:hypothetical protein
MRVSERSPDGRRTLFFGQSRQSADIHCAANKAGRAFMHVSFTRDRFTICSARRAPLMARLALYGLLMERFNRSAPFAGRLLKPSPLLRG